MILIKMLHIFALLLGISVSSINLVIASQAAKGGEGIERWLALRPTFSRLGLFAVLVIWISGVWLYTTRWDGVDLGVGFWLKLAAAAALLVVVFMINLLGAIAARTGTPPPAYMARLGPASFALTLIATALAVWVFG